MALKPGKRNDFANSMAQRMEAVFESEWLALKGKALPDTSRDERRVMFIAVAQGIVRYLRDNDHHGFDVHGVDSNSGEGSLRVNATGVLTP